MARKKTDKEAKREILRVVYFDCLNAIKNNGGTIYGECLEAETGHKSGEIKKAIQFMRRHFNDELSQDTSRLIGCKSNGYFIVSNEAEGIAFALSMYKDGISRIKTAIPIIKYFKKTCPDKLKTAVDSIDQSRTTGIDLEVHPWGVFDSVMSLLAKE